MSKQSSPATQTTTSEPWKPTQSHLKNILGTAEGLFNENPNGSFFPGQTFAESDFRQQAAAGLAQRAQDPNGLINQAQGAVSGALAPNMGAIGDAVRAEVIPQITSQFQTAGRSGSALEQEAIARGTARGLAPYALQAQGQALTAANMAPGLASADLGQLERAGLAQEQLDQRGINESMQRFNFEQNAPWQQLAQYSNIAQGQAGLGGTQTTVSQEAQASPFQQALGLGLGAAGLFMGGPAGAAAGSSLGGGMGLGFGGLY